MNVVVFGASGRTGIPLVQQALDAGLDVTAFVRTPSKLPIQHERLTVVQGDAMNLEDVERAIEGADAVISVLGDAKNTPRDLMAKAADNIVTAMKRHNVKKLITLTGAGVGAPEDQPKPINHVIKFLLKTISPQVLADSERHVEIIKTSGLDWIVVRGPMLTEQPKTDSYRIGWVGVNTGARARRTNIADFMIKLAQNGHDYLHKMPMISD
jgi:putative NADH-flavin reductase